ncbi:MAG TPA: hypothetical protein DC057_02310, partial [Spirochaetia bacterium]|nr:hypothetical protein [Spirochaetia bacterium]
MDKRLYSVKSHNLEMVSNRSVVTNKGQNLAVYVTKVTLLARNLSFEQAKKIRNENKSLNASI